MVIGFARQVIRRIAQKMNVAALPDRLGQGRPDRSLQTRVVVADG